MRLRMLFLVSLPCLLLLAACARTVHAPPAALTPTPPDTPVLLLRTAPPTAVRYQLIGPVVVCRTATGRADWALDRLADAARTAGATAVMHVRVSVGPSWCGWATQRGTGMAIRILEPSAEEVSQLPTVQAEWR
jgi:hypothetical protein